RTKSECKPEAERDQSKQAAVVRNNDVVEHELKTYRDSDANGLENQRHPQHLGRRRSETIGATQQIVDPNPRTRGLGLETVGRPAFKHDSGRAFANLLYRDRSTAHGWGMDDHAATA